METATLLYIILATIAALLIAVFQYFYKNKEKVKLNYWLSFLRFLSVFFILLLFINPSIKKKETQLIKPNLLIAADNSSSIKNLKQDSLLINIIQNFKNDNELNEKFKLEFFAFGEHIYKGDSLNFTENHTNLSKPLKQFSNIYKDENTPIILITDGNQTAGENVEFINYKKPVFPIIIGDTTILEDIYISKLNTNKNTYINNKFPVEIYINYQGNKPVFKALNIYHKGKKIHSQAFKFSKTENVKTVSTYIEANEKGRQFYTAKIEELSNEHNTLNNSKNFSVNVIDEKVEILVVYKTLHPDLGMLKKSIESNKQRSVTLIKTSDYKGNTSKYQLIILYQPTTDFNSVFNDVETKKINYFIITGTNTDWNFLNNTQNNFSKKYTSETESYHPIFNVNYDNFLLDDIGFSDFAPLDDIFGNTTFNIPFKTLLYQRIGNFKTEKPLLATFEKNNQKGAVLFGKNLWRWRSNSFHKNKTFEIFDGFISNLIQYLSSTKKNKQLAVSTSSLYFSNEPIKFSASYLDENFNFDDRAKLWLTISNSEKNFIKKVPFAIEENRFITELTNLSPYEYNFTVTVEGQDISENGSFKILPFEVEQQFSNANDSQLKILAEKTGGEIYYSNQVNEVLSKLKTDNRFKTIQKEIFSKKALIDWQWILGLIVLLLSIEWVVRKYFGKI